LAGNEKLEGKKARAESRKEKLRDRKEKLEERLDRSEQKRRTMAESAQDVKERMRSILEQAAAQADAPLSPDQPCRAPRFPPGELAKQAKTLSYGRMAGLAANVWMQPEEYVQHLNLSPETVGGEHQSILDAMTRVLYLDLPVPWEAHCTEEQQIYFAQMQSEPSIASWDHPMRHMHVDIAAALQRAVAAGNGGLTAVDAQPELLRLLDRAVDPANLLYFGTWEPTRETDAATQERGCSPGPTGGALSYCKISECGIIIGQRRFDDPRLAVASQIGLTLAALRCAWESLSSTDNAEPFPFSDDDGWRTAAVLAESVVVKPHSRRSERSPTRAERSPTRATSSTARSSGEKTPPCVVAASGDVKDSALDGSSPRSTSHLHGVVAAKEAVVERLDDRRRGGASRSASSGGGIVKDVATPTRSASKGAASTAEISTVADYHAQPESRSRNRSASSGAIAAEVSTNHKSSRRSSQRKALIAAEMACVGNSEAT